MLNIKEFKKYGYEFIDWIANYYSNIENYPVKSQVQPGDIYSKLPDKPPLKGETIEEIIKDFNEIIIPGITHWQSPNFYAYFPANTSFPSILAEMLTSALGVQGMKWETSPAAAELEELVMNWLKKMTGIPDNFDGVIQDTASTSTLAAVLTAREKYSGFKINKSGFQNNKFRVYCSTETHSSIEKAVKIAGIGKNNLIKIKTDNNFGLIPELLEDAVQKDLSKSKKPLCIIATLGTTSSTAVDSLKLISNISKKYDIWLHIDAAYAGNSLILPEYKWMLEGIENADSIVFNPHKWLFTNFDCSAFFIKEKEYLIRTFEIIPEYLKTVSDAKKVNNYCDWGIPLGRRFRALKLWFVIRNYGIEGIQDTLRKHISIAKNLEEEIKKDNRFEILAPVNFNLICFRYNPGNIDEETLNNINESLMHNLNKTGKIYLSHTKLNGKFTLRIVTGQTYLRIENVRKAWELIKETINNILSDFVSLS